MIAEDRICYELERSEETGRSFEDLKNITKLPSEELLVVIQYLKDKGEIEEDKELSYWYKLAKKERPDIILPKEGKLITEFCEEIANLLKNQDLLFYRRDLKEIVEITPSGFSIVKPARFVTLVEQYFRPGIEREDDYGNVHFNEKSMNINLATVCLASRDLQEELHPVERIFNVPMPIIHNNMLTFPFFGYDRRFNSWTPYDAPQIDDNMGLAEAKEIISKIFAEFCFETKEAGESGADFTNALAALITPFLRGIFPTFSTRTPIFFYHANRERCGKDYLAGITGILYEGLAIEESAVSVKGEGGNNSEELRKKILASLIAGRKRLHFANNKGYIDNATLEAFATAEHWTDRVLGKNETLSFPNEVDISLSGNVGITFTPDLANRSRFIRLFYDQEDANARMFENPDLHGWVAKNRALVLSALYTLVRNWFEKGQPKGSLPFSSFPQWAAICGGILEAAGYENPCKPAMEVVNNIGGDSETQDMKMLFEACYEADPDKWVKKSDIKAVILNSETPIFGYLNFDEKKDQIVFGIKIEKFVGRVLSGIRLIVKDHSVRSARREYMFRKDQNAGLNKFNVGSVGNIGNADHSVVFTKNPNDKYTGRSTLP